MSNTISDKLTIVFFSHCIVVRHYSTKNQHILIKGFIFTFSFLSSALHFFILIRVNSLYITISCIKKVDRRNSSSLNSHEQSKIKIKMSAAGKLEKKNTIMLRTRKYNRKKTPNMTSSNTTHCVRPTFSPLSFHFVLALNKEGKREETEKINEAQREKGKNH